MAQEPDAYLPNVQEPVKIDSVAQKKSLSDSEMTNLMDRFEERRVQWVAASNTIEARLRKSCAIPRATGWAELEADDFELRQRWRRQLDSDSDSDGEDSCEVRVHIPLAVLIGGCFADAAKY